MSSNDLRVQTRSGYVALPPALTAKGSLLHSYEVPLLTALDATELPHAFSYHSGAMHFRGQRNQPVCALVIDIPLVNLTFQKNTTDQIEGHLYYVAVVKDSKGEVLKKFRNDIPVHLAAAQQEALKTMHFIYTQHFDLPAGHYAIETAVLDGEGNRISARKNSFIMLPPSTTLSMSSVSIVRSTKAKDASSDATDPLLIGTNIISPTLNPVISKSDTTGVSFYMVVYPNRNSAILPKLSMELSRNGQVLGSAPVELVQPDSDGRIQNVATVPVASLEGGEYAIRFIVTQGSESAEEATSFTIR
jgi:hypothetical protein